MTKVINLNGQRYILPSMSNKDIASLAGVLVTLTPVVNEYDYDKSEYMYAPSAASAQVQIEELELVDLTTARTVSRSSYENYKQRQAAAKETADT
jgi:hypothetical protein